MITEYLKERCQYKIGDEVYHTTSGDKGIIVDITYSVRLDEFRYLVSFGFPPDCEVSCLDLEISKEKSVI